MINRPLIQLNVSHFVAFLDQTIGLACFFLAIQDVQPVKRRLLVMTSPSRLLVSNVAACGCGPIVHLCNLTNGGMTNLQVVLRTGARDSRSKTTNLENGKISTAARRLPSSAKDVREIE